MAQSEKCIELVPFSSLETSTPSQHDHSDIHDDHRTQDHYGRRRRTKDVDNQATSSPSRDKFKRRISTQPQVHATPTTPSELPLLNVQEPNSSSSSSLHTFQNPKLDCLADPGVNDSEQKSNCEWNWDSASIYTEGKCPDDTSLTKSRYKKLLKLLDTMRSTVVRHLLTLQVVLFVISLLLSGMVFMPLSLVFQGFRSQCLLFSDISLTWNSNNTVTIDLTTSHFGPVEQCNVTTFIAVSDFVVCIIFSWFYLCSIFSANGSDETKQSTNKIQIPALLIFLALFISTIVGAAKISAGFRIWCENIVDNQPDGPGRKLSCSDFETLNWTNNINNYQFYTRFKIAEVACWLLCVSLFALCCVTCVGCYHMLLAADKLATSQATLSVSLEESEDGSLVVVKTKHKNEEKGELEGSSQDYFTPMEDQMLSSDEPELRQNRHNEVLLSTEATVHSEPTPLDNNFYTERNETAAVNDAFLSDISDHEEYLKSEKVSSGRINTSVGDEVLSLASPSNRGHGVRSEDDFLKTSEKEALSKNVSVNGGYGAVSSQR